MFLSRNFTCHVFTTLLRIFKLSEIETLTSFSKGDFNASDFFNEEPTLLVPCLYWMSPLNHKRTTSSLAPPIIYVVKNWK
jgi:hypothetical protein